MQAVPITDIGENSISSADIVTDPIIGTFLISVHLKLDKSTMKNLWTLAK